MEHVAARAGVSRALVSIVFRGVAGASEATRERVLAAARELDYRPDTRASLLGSSQTTTQLARLAMRVPVVSVLRPAPGEEVGVVRTDDAAGLRLAVEHLRALGHTRIAL